jgi:hypothetical protein
MVALFVFSEGGRGTRQLRSVGLKALCGARHKAVVRLRRHKGGFASAVIEPTCWRRHVYFALKKTIVKAYTIIKLHSYNGRVRV